MDLLKQVEAELAAAEAELAKLREKVAALKKAKAALTPKDPPKTGGNSKGRAKAGPAAIQKVATTLADGPVTQAKITHATGLNSGQVSAAISDLEAEGVIRRTGVKQGRSHEYELTTPV